MSDVQINIASTWRKLVTGDHAETFAPHLSRMNDFTGQNIQHNRFRQWELGNFKPSRETIHFMLREVLISRLEFYLDDDHLRSLLREISF